MPKCFKCGRRSLTLKLDSNGLCPECSDQYYRLRAERAKLMESVKKKQALIRLESLPVYSFFPSSASRKRRRGYDGVKMSNITPKGVYDRFTAIDVETTGLAPSKDRIVEVGAVRFCNGAPVERFSSFVNPEHPIPPDLSDMSGITNEMVSCAPLIGQILPAFELFVGDDLIIGHNLDFDLRFLFYSGSILFDTKRKYIDTLEQAQKLLRKPRRVYDSEYDLWDYDYYSPYDVENHKLATLCNYYGIIHPGPHRADADALVTGDLFLCLVREKLDRM